MADPAPTIDRLLQLVPDSPDGYSLLHAATSWNQMSLLKPLIEEFKVDPNIKDESEETCLFNAESVDFAKELLRLGVNINAVNDEGQTAADYLDHEDEAPQVAAYLRQIMAERSDGPTSASINQGNESANASTLPNGDATAVHAPPPLPNGVQVNIGTMHANEVGDEPDPDFRRRIEELAARQDFEGEEGQRELRNLVEEAISGLGGEGQGAATRRRVG